ncbi:MAG: hypothetical protein ABII79_10140 [bacterium]
MQYRTVALHLAKMLFYVGCIEEGAKVVADLIGAETCSTIELDDLDLPPISTPLSMTLIQSAARNPFLAVAVDRVPSGRVRLSQKVIILTRVERGVVSR